MAGNFKYTMHKHRGKVWAIVSLLTLVVIGIGLYFLFTQETFDNEPHELEQEKTIAEHILTGNQDGTLRLISVESNQTVDEMTLPDGHYVYQMSKNYETLYVYNGTEVKAYEVKRGEIREGEVIASIEVENVESFKVDGETIAFLSDNDSHLTLIYPDSGGISTREIETDESVIDYGVKEQQLLYSTSEHLHVVKPNGEQVLEIGDITPTILTTESKWVISNLFGSGLDSNTLMVLDEEDNLIEDVSTTENKETMLLDFDQGEEEIYTTHYVEATEPYHLLTTWYLENNQLTKEADMTIRIPVKEDGILYDHQTSVTGGNYLYTHFDDRVQIFDIRSQQVHANIETDIYFAKPILK